MAAAERVRNEKRRGPRLRPYSENRKQQERALVERHGGETEIHRPRTRADCEDGPRPCPFIGCRLHLAIDVNHVGSIKWNRTLDALDAARDTCALDVAERAERGLTLGEVGLLLSITRERVRQIEKHALIKVRAAMREIRGNRE